MNLSRLRTEYDREIHELCRSQRISIIGGAAETVVEPELTRVVLFVTLIAATAITDLVSKRF